jgi:6-pyruvoyltetrahydropterin/6-carboxytetrahydropterin synthase
MSLAEIENLAESCREQGRSQRAMYQVARELEFCYGHRLLNYPGKCRHLHGHNGRAIITLEAEALDERGMLVDFADIKQKVQRWVDDNLDHNMILCKDDPIVPVLKAQGERFFLMDSNPTAENIARLIFDHAYKAGLPVVKVQLWETANCHASYQMTSGMATADGMAAAWREPTWREVHDDSVV